MNYDSLYILGCSLRGWRYNSDASEALKELVEGYRNILAAGYRVAEITADNVPELIDKYGDKFTFMGGIDEAVLDDPASTPQSAMEYAAKCIDECGSISFIPCQTRELGMTIIPEGC